MVIAWINENGLCTCNWFYNREPRSKPFTQEVLKHIPKLSDYGM